MSSISKKQLAIIVGAGPGLGVSLATQLAMSDYKVVALNRSKINNDNERIKIIQLDASDVKSSKNTIESIINQYGVPHVLIHNPAQLLIKPFLETSYDEFKLAWQDMVMSAFNVFRAVLPGMVQRGEGTIIVSGATASLRAGENFSAFASAKFALRGLTQSVAREYQKKGIHVAHVILDGILDTSNSRILHSMNPSDMMSTDEVALAYLQVIEQKPSAWTHELDLRPTNEKF
ncbi:MAG: SDR family NAD(P)-dependent oxidoreductase [Gammaproteobacteria bacterium]|nr:SDR family NAD(P)-dependent oxidoreductase [Gammaproteobacteria bacterium]